MKILFISSSPLEYSSSANLRNLALIKGLDELGHEISTFTAEPVKGSTYFDLSLDKVISTYVVKRYYIKAGNLYSNFDSYKSNKLKAKIKKNIKKIAYNLLNSISIYDQRKRFVKKVKQFKIEEKYDLIISSSDPKSSHLIAESLIESNPSMTKKWVQYWGDPFTNDINKRSRFSKKAIKKEESRILEKADIVVYVSPFTLEKQKSTFPSLSYKFRFIPIPYFSTNDTQVDNNMDPKYELGYFGDYYSRDRNIKPLYNLAKKLKLKLIICGNSDVHIEKDDNIVVNSRVSLDEVKKYEMESKILVCICNIKGTQIPGKVYHYAATRNPILIIVDGNNKEQLKSYFDKFDRYILCDNNEESIKSAILTIRKTNEDFSPATMLSPYYVADRFMQIVYS